MERHVCTIDITQHAHFFVTAGDNNCFTLHAKDDN